MFDNVNVYILIGFIIRLIALAVLVFYIVPRQFIEVLRPRDWLTGLRWQILLLFVLSIIASIPPLIYQLLRLNEVDSEILRNVATITGNLSTLGMTVLIVLIFNYKRR